VDVGGTFNERLELFFGQTSEAMARVYARLRDFEAPPGVQLTGSLTGPSCLYAETLPARFPLIDRGPGEAMVAEAVVPEPCFWTPEMPQLYQASVQLRLGSQIVASADRMFGFRTLGASGRKLIYEGRRWVLRAVRRDAVPSASLDNWHASDAAMVVRDPDDNLCRAASRAGVLIVAELDSVNLNQIHRLSSWPAVAMVILPGDAAVDLAGLKHNMLLAARIGNGHAWNVPCWAHLVQVDVEDARRLANDLTTCPVPIIARRNDVEQYSAVATARAGCDRLQQEVVGRSELNRLDLAGYLV
jgi:hypothetical protein